MKNTIPVEISFEKAIKLILNKELKFRRSAKKAPGEIQISSGSCISFANSDDLSNAGSLGSLDYDYGHFKAVPYMLSSFVNGARMQNLVSNCGWKVSSCEENAIKAEFRLNQLASNFM